MRKEMRRIGHRSYSPSDEPIWARKILYKIDGKSNNVSSPSTKSAND